MGPRLRHAVVRIPIPNLRRVRLRSFCDAGGGRLVLCRSSQKVQTVLDVKNEDLRSIPELFSAAIDWSCEDGEGDWTAVVALQRIGSKEVLEKALQLLEAVDPRSRARAADILGQLGSPGRTYLDECLTAVVRLLAQDTDARVLEAAAVAVGHLKDPRGTQEVIRVADHPDPEVRQAVAFALGGSADLDAIAALILLTSDDSAYVRDWATFGVGAINSLDTPEIREALYRRIDDVDEDTRFEALCGLARCGDLRAVRPLIDAISKNKEDFSLWLPAETLLKMDLDSEDMTADGLIAQLDSLIDTEK
jgi:HEAT repeat protein